MGRAINDKDPAILFYPKDFISETQFLSFEDRGKLVTFWSVYHQHGKLSKKKMEALMEGNVPVDLEEFFKVDEDGLFYSPEVDEAVRKRKKFKEGRSQDGIKGNRVKTVMKELSLTAEEARAHLEEHEGLKFGKDKYMSTPSVRNNGNAIGNGNINTSPITSTSRLEEIVFKQETDQPLTDSEKSILEQNNMNYEGQFDQTPF
ncbi:MAG: hypothetical protein ABJG78_12445 [Cyclobacteriaceae bacterium]